MSKKLEVGITKIGTTSAMDSKGVLYQSEPGKYDFNILYGNILTPFVNGEILHLPPDFYQTKLYDFLNTEEGKQYEQPTEEEIRNASLEMLRREQALKKDLKKNADENKNSSEQHSLSSQPEEEYNPMFDELLQEGEPAADDSSPSSGSPSENLPSEKQDTHHKEEKEKPVSKKHAGKKEEKKQNNRNLHSDSKIQEKPSDSVPAAFSSDQVYKFIQADRLNEQIADLSKDNSDLKVQIHKGKISRRVMAAILILSMAVNGFFGYQYLTGKQQGVDYAEMNINGIKYEVPVANVEVAEGQKKIMIYGFTVTNENGQIKNVAVPLGEFVVKD